LGLFSSIASVFGAKKKKKAVQQAAAVQTQAAQAGADKVAEQQQAFLDQFGEFQKQQAQFQSQLEPYLGAGAKSVGAQQDLLGLNGSGVQASALDALKASPLFQQLFGAGQDAVLSSASATGGLRGGNAQRSLYDAGEDTFAQVIQQQLSNLGGLTGAGLTATGQGLGALGQGLGALGQFGQTGSSSADTIAQLLGNKGAAQAGGILGSAAASQQLWSALGGLGDLGAEVLLGIPSGGSSGSSGQSGGGINMAAIAKAFM
jgi:hypothetical protein